MRHGDHLLSERVEIGVEVDMVKRSDAGIAKGPRLRLHDLPVWVQEVEIGEALTDICPPSFVDGRPYRRVRLFVRLHHQPIGYALLRTGAASAAEVAGEIWAQLGPRINDHLGLDAMAPVSSLPLTGLDGEGGDTPACRAVEQQDDLPLISVVVCTRDRPDGAEVTLRDLRELAYPNYEILVVDNAPTTQATRELIEKEFSDDSRIRYVLEPRPGLSCARNRGLAEARGEFVAFTDDDVHVDRWWLHGILRGFRRDQAVGCVTGLVPSASLESASQLYFDQRIAWGVKCEYRLFDLTDHRDDSLLYPYSAGIYGTGANFALRKTTAVAIGAFDEALGAGTPSGGGEDLDAFLKVILKGHSLVYEPSAIISHVHRNDVAELTKQLFNYGCGFTAYLCKHVLKPRTALDILTRIPAGVLRMAGIAKTATAIDAVPRSVMVHEFRGMLYGPMRYFQGKRRIAHLSTMAGDQDASH